ncbi:MAG: AAA family ATPase, partial [Planctomycetaceae bacterium]|nr:AAA family ATPase [Planctomycetaceae bacterium]
RFHVTTDDIRAVAKPVLRHRIMTTFAAASQGVTSDTVVERLLKFVPVELHERARKRVHRA